MKDEIKKILAELLKVEINNIPDDISQKNLPTWDSLLHLNLIIALEQRFGISFEPEEMAELNSMDSILQALKNKKQ